MKKSDVKLVRSIENSYRKKSTRKFTEEEGLKVRELIQRGYLKESAFLNLTGGDGTSRLHQLAGAFPLEENGVAEVERGRL